MNLLRAQLRLALLVVFATIAVQAFAQSAHSSSTTDFGTVNVGSTSPTILVTFTFDAPIAPDGWGVYTNGALGLDFNEVPASTTCSVAIKYNVGDTCSVAISLAPKYPGLRMGVVQLLDASGNAIATARLRGVGSGPQAFFPSTQSPQVLAPMHFFCGVVVDGNGNVFFCDPVFVGSGGSVLKEIVASGGKVSSASPIVTIATGFWDTNSLAIDGAGNLFLTDATGVHEFFAANGVVSSSSTQVLVGSGFVQPYGVTVDADGNVFVADYGASALKEIVAVNGLVSGTSTVINLYSDSVKEVALDTLGDVYFSGNRTYTHPIDGALKELVAVGGHVSPTSSVRVLWELFNELRTIAVDAAGDVYIPDTDGGGFLLEFPAVNGQIPDGTLPITISAVQPIGTIVEPEFGFAFDQQGNIFESTFRNGTEVIAEFPTATPPTVNFTANMKVPPSVIFANSGNATLSFPLPSSGTNPSLSANFSLGQPSTCLQTDPASAVPFTLAPGSSCTAAIDYTPVSFATTTGTLVWTDDSLNRTTTHSLTINGLLAPFGGVEGVLDSTTNYPAICVSDNALFHGWAADPVDGAPVSQVQVLVDGTIVGDATLQGSRRDIASTFGSKYLQSGWTFSYPASGLSVGLHIASAIATDSLGFSSTLPRHGFKVSTSSCTGPFGHIDSVTDAVTHSTTIAQSDSLLVNGWAGDATDGAPVAGGIEVFIDLADVGAATVGLSRPDLAKQLGTAYLKSGWSFQYPASALNPGKHYISGIATDAAGKLSYLYLSQYQGFNVVKSQVSGPPFGAVDALGDSTTRLSTISQAGSLLVAGWAADVKDGAPVGGGVQILVDDVAVGSATLGIARPDVANKVGSTYRNSGWTFTMSASGFALGNHVVQVVATNSLGGETTLKYAPITITK